MRCDMLLRRLALFVFDAAINHGHAAATIMLQEHQNVHPDGIIGPGTLAAMRNVLPNRDHEFMALRALRYVNYVAPEFMLC